MHNIVAARCLLLACLLERLVEGTSEEISEILIEFGFA